jgi:Lon protease-like protein
MNLPAQVGVMTLPNAILFPRALLPLYIFEPRYRRMLATALQGDRIFAVALRRPNNRRQQPHTVMGLGIIRTSVERPDGTSHLILEGLARVRVREYVQLRPYRIARVEPLASIPTAPPHLHQQLVAAVQRLTAARAEAGLAVPKELVETLVAMPDTELLTDLAGHALLADCQAKQQLLEELAVADRLRRLVALLDAEARFLALGKFLQGDLPNDHVGRN